MTYKGQGERFRMDRKSSFPEDVKLFDILVCPSNGDESDEGENTGSVTELQQPKA